MLSYPAAIRLSNRTLVRLADLIRAERTRRRSRWRRLDPGRQALLVLAHLRNSDTHTRLAIRFDISYSTAWRYVREAVDLLVALADDLRTAGERAARLAYAILDGTLVPIDRVTNRKPYYSGKHRRHGVNVQVLADPAGRLVWASAALPGAVHDLTAARTHGLLDVLTAHFRQHGVSRDRRHGAHSVQTPRRTSAAVTRPEGGQPGTCPHPRPRRTRRVAAERWKVLVKLRCCPRRATAIVAAIFVLRHIETRRQPR